MLALIRRLGSCATVLLLVGMTSASHAALFEDDDARRAIIDLRQKLEAFQLRQADEAKKSADNVQGKLAEENGQLRRSILDLGNQIEQLRAEVSRLRGQDEQLSRDVAEVQRRLKDVSLGVDDRLKKFEPTKVSVDGREFVAEPAETREFDAALAIMRGGDFAQAQTVFSDFLRRYPSSGYKPSALFWLGNAQYAVRNYRESIASFRAMLNAAPDHVRAPEAVLSIANCQVELKEPRPAVRKTLDDLLKAYPQSEAAAVAKERLAKLK